MKDLFYVDSKTTGGHYAFKTEKSKKPFENPMSECKSLKLLTTDVVADIGAYVGEYSLFAVSQGVKKVVAYEATPETAAILELNSRGRVKVHNLAVVGNNAKKVDLYISKGIGVTNSIAKVSGKADKVSVKTIKYDQAVKSATVVKIDVEGAEYGYDILGNLEGLRGIIIEFHPIVGFDWVETANHILNSIEAAGFTCIHRANFKSGWSLISSFVKEKI